MGVELSGMDFSVNLELSNSPLPLVVEDISKGQRLPKPPPGLTSTSRAFFITNSTMAKDLPYFKFHVSEWISGNISLQDPYLQGVFINICCYYWSRSGNLLLSEIKQRLFNVKPNAFSSLQESGFLVVKRGIISIKFLDEQMGERVAKSASLSKNGKLGGRPKKAKALTPESNIEKRREEETRKEERERREYGITHENFIVVKAKYITEAPVRINGKDGLIAYMAENQTVLNMPEHGEKFMRWAKGKVFNELAHVQNSYAKYIEKQYQ